MKVIKYILVSANVLLLACGSLFVFYENGGLIKQVLLTVLFLFFSILNLCSYLYFRRRFINFSSSICNYAGNIINGGSVKNIQNKETLSSKAVTELEKMYRIIMYRLEENKKDKKELQKMVSEITHQIKTPLSNINMYCGMLSDEDIIQEQSVQFVDVIKKQLVKLEFLLDTLIKSSRLETEMINLEPADNRVIETLAVAVNDIIYKAGHKNIEISVDCRSSIRVYHDMKWTAEAIGNILDNAVKYTPENGKIHISVNTGEMYTEIKIRDTGKGIETAHINDIFKRFYREKSVSKIEGLGLGLYLARHIITLQKGYISVHSVQGKGSCFSVCLPNRF